MLKELIANIPSTKKLIIIDTCSAGALGEAIQVAMLTRGMSEDTAMKILSRAVETNHSFSFYIFAGGGGRLSGAWLVYLCACRRSKGKG